VPEWRAARSMGPMSQTERLYKLKSLVDAGKCLSKATLLDELGISPATLKRDIAHLRDRMNAPIKFDRERKGWRLDRSAAVIGTQYELPGLWFSAAEIHALLTMQHLLAHLDAGGLLGSKCGGRARFTARAWIETPHPHRAPFETVVARASRLSQRTEWLLSDAAKSVRSRNTVDRWPSY